jgi:hypothetical protein
MMDLVTGKSFDKNLPQDTSVLTRKHPLCTVALYPFVSIAGKYVICSLKVDEFKLCITVLVLCTP